jgi:hypothetical protein
MKERILKNWTVVRFFYLSLGLFIAIASIVNQEWLGVFLGSYFTSMGLFAFGCAAGQCSGNIQKSNSTNPDKDSEFVEFEEVK